MLSELTHTHPHTQASGAQARTARAYAAMSPNAAMQPFSIERRAVGPTDVGIQILFCGVCHSDLHQVRNEWQGTMPTQYPCVPGHEIVGRVVAVGSKVTRFREGDLAGVGCLVASCGACQSCRAGLENYCERVPTLTYNSVDAATGAVTYGGYSESIVVDEKFTLRISDKLDLAATAPLLCAGITTYSPLRHWKVGKGQKVGVVGLGGLGHMGVKFAHAFGARVVLFTTSEGKRADGLRFGADEVVVSRNADEMAKHVNSFDFILDTVSAPHDINAYISLLGLNGTLTMVVPPTPRRSSAWRAGWSRCTPRSRRSASPPPSSIRGSSARSSSPRDRRTTPSRPSRTTTSAERSSSSGGKPRMASNPDPAKLARALIMIGSQEPPPRRFIAGAGVIALAEQKVADLTAQIDADRDLSTSLAFDREPAARAM